MPTTPHAEAAPSNRSFGLTVGGVFAAIAVYQVLWGGWPEPVVWSLGVLGAGLMLFGLIAPAVLAPLNRAWMGLGRLLALVVTPVVMFVVYALTVVPIGLAMRALGRDPLRLRMGAEDGSYWIRREPPGPPPDSMKDQF